MPPFLMGMNYWRYRRRARFPPLALEGGGGTLIIRRAETGQPLLTLAPGTAAKGELRGADLNGANLAGLDLAGADLAGADLEGCLLDGTDLRDADLRGARLTNAMVFGVDVTGARYDGATRWPPGFLPAWRGCVRAAGEPAELSPSNAPSGRGDEPSAGA
jgi:hypothetical protein